MTYGSAPLPAARAARPGRRAPLGGLAVLALCVAASFALYGRALRLGWCCDDTQVLLQLSRHAPWQYFTQPPVWRTLSPYFLTPWLTLSYHLDHALAGFRPAVFQAHQLLSIGLCAVLLWRLARHWVSPLWASVAALLFLLGTPVAHASQTLMLRHYIEGLGFLMLALWLAIGHLQGGSAWRLVGAGLCFALAAAAKELFLPLGLLPLLLPWGRWRQRCLAFAPFGLVMLLYLPWRWFMLGDLVGGYTPRSALAATPLVQVLQQLAGVPAMLWAPVALPLAALPGAALLVAWQAPRAAGAAALRVAGGAVLLALPLLPLTHLGALVPGNERLVLAVWAAVVLVAALMMHRLCAAPGAWRRAAALALALALAVPARLASGPTMQRDAALHLEHEALGQALLTQPPDSAVMLQAGVPDHFLQGLMALRPALGAHQPPPQRVADEAELAALPSLPAPITRYDAATGRMRDVAAEMPAQLAAWRARLRDAPLALVIERDPRRQQLRWQFDTPAPGRFALLAPGRRLDVPAAAGAVRMGQPLPPCFRVRFDAEAGWTAYTPLLALGAPDGQGAQRLQWQGRAGAPDGARCP